MATQIPRRDPLSSPAPLRVPARGVRSQKLVESAVDASLISGIPFSGVPTDGQVITFVAADNSFEPKDPTLLAVPTHAIDSSYHSNMLRVTAGSGLISQVDFGRVQINITVFDIAAGSLTLTPSATNYIYVNSSGSLAFATTGFPASCIPLAVAVTGASSITSLQDRRSVFFNTTAGGGGTSDHALLTDLAFSASAHTGPLSLTQHGDVSGDSATKHQLSQISPRAHATLTGLTVDDHTQYLLLTGRSGGQSASGDTLTGGVLTLRGNAADTTGRVDVLTDLKMATAGKSIMDNGTNARIALSTASPNITLTGDTQVTGGVFSVNVAPNANIYGYVGNTGAGVDGKVGLLVDMGGTSGANAGTVIGIAGRAIAKDAATLSSYGLDYVSGVSNTLFTSPFTAVYGARTQLFLSASGKTLTDYYGFYATPGTLIAGTVTNWSGFVVPALTIGSNRRPFYDAGTTTSGDTRGNVFASNTQLCSTVMAFGGGNRVIGIADAIGNPTTNPASGVVHWSAGSQLYQRGLMSVNEPLHSTVAALAAGTAYASSNSETALNNAVFTFPANALVAGSVWRLTARGVYSTATATTPTFQMRCRWGGVAGVLLGDSGANNMGLGVTNLGWKVEFTIRVVSIGATGTMECQGEFDYDTTAIAINSAYMVNTGVITVDTTASKDLVLTGTWGTNSASNTLTVRSFIVERVS